MNELKFPPLPKRSTCGGRRSAAVSCPISSTLSCQKIRTPTSNSARRPRRLNALSDGQRERKAGILRSEPIGVAEHRKKGTSFL